MQNFCKVSQGNNEKVPSFASRLEGTLHQILLQCPGRMTDLEAQQHFRDCLFHGVRKPIHDYIWYLYSIPGVLYSQLMVAAWKTKSENDETQDQVVPRLQWPLSQWRAWLIWNNRLSSWPRAAAIPVPWAVPRSMDMDVDTVEEKATADWTLRMGVVAQPHSLLLGYLGEDAGGISNEWGNGGMVGSQGTSIRGDGTVNCRDPLSFQCYRYQGRGHMAKECPTPASALNHPGWSQMKMAHPQLAAATWGNNI